MRFLGIDPGTTRIGYGVIEEYSGKLKSLAFGLLPITGLNGNEKILSAGKSISSVIKKHKPDLIAIEKIFFTKNQKTAVSVAESRGVLKLVALQSGLPVREYGPGEIKLAVTSNGIADKKAVAFMVKKILTLENIDGPDDISDALAIAITAAFRHKIDSL